MIAKDVLTRIKEIEIQTRRLLSGMLVGDSTSAIKGTGFEFDQIREYTQGDDVRFIDWNSSARMNTLLVKQFMEERNRTILLAVDCSSSMFFSSCDQRKYDVAAQVASVLALVAGYGKDHVGLFLFSDEVCITIPPKQGFHHVHKIMHTVLSQERTKEISNASTVYDAIARLKKRDMIVFLVSGFLHEPDTKKLSVLARKHDVVAIRCLDPYEKQLPYVGAVHTTDSAQCEDYFFQLHSKTTKNINEFLYSRLSLQNRMFRKHAVDVIDLQTDKPFVGDLVRFFRKRMMY